MNKKTVIKWLERLARWWMAYVLISNAGVGTLIPLEDIGLTGEPLLVFQSLWKTNFLMHAAKIVELLGGIAFIFNFYTPLVLVGLVPVVVNIYGIHLFMFGNILTNGLGMLMICLYLLYKHRERYYPLLKRS